MDAQCTSGMADNSAHCNRSRHKANCWRWKWPDHGQTSARRTVTENMYDVLVSYSPLFIKWPAKDL